MLPTLLKEEVINKEKKIKELTIKLEKTNNEIEKMLLLEELRKMEDELQRLYEFYERPIPKNWKEETQKHIEKLESQMKNLKEDYSPTLSKEYYRTQIALYKYYIENEIPPGRRKNIPFIVVIGLLIENYGSLLFPLLFIYLFSGSFPFEKENNGLLWILQTKEGKKITFALSKYLVITLTCIGICLLVEAIGIFAINLIHKANWNEPVFVFTKYTFKDNNLVPIYNSSISIPIIQLLKYIFISHILYLIFVASFYYFLSIILSTTTKFYLISLLSLLLSQFIINSNNTQIIAPWIPFAYYSPLEILGNDLMIKTKNLIFHYPFPLIYLLIWSITLLAFSLYLFSIKRQRNITLTRG